MKQNPRQNGFVLLIVVFLLGIMVVGITVWAAQTKDLINCTKLQTTQAGLDNAIASAAQWARINPKTLKQSPERQWIRLDLKELQSPGLECHYRVVEKDAHHAKIEITASGNFRSHPIKKTVRLTL
jgi:hypothetical protein